MRPNPSHRSARDDSGRIIYLGDVRRRRGAGRQEPDTHYLVALVIAAIGGYGVWLAVLFALPPARLLTYVAFFAPLWLGLAATCTIGAYAVEWRRGLFPRLGRCGRRGALVAGAIVANLAFQAAHRWSVLVLLVSVGAALLLDVATSARSAE